MPTPPPAPHTTGAPASYGQPGPAYSQPAASGYPNYSQPQSPNYPPQPPTPAVPYPGQPAPTQPAGQALVPGQAPGYPVPAGQPAAAKTTIVMPAFDIKSEALALWQAVSAIFRSRPVETLKVAENSRWYVYLMALIAPLLSGLLLATLGSRTVGGVVSFGESLTGGAYKSGYSLPWGAWFSLLFTAFFVTIVLVALRALFIHFTFMVHGAKQPLMRSFQIVTAACAPMVFALGITWLLTLIPSAGLVVVVLVVAWLVLGWLQFVNEMVIYIGINRAARFQRSPVMIHATFSALWAIIAGVLIATMIVPSAEYLIPDIF
ncbi:MAG: hypothetical protein Q4P06_04285 [Actinomycetaceae bacterium]|nr:hypothetical protein [Actinomycetaceae bacterium]